MTKILAVLSLCLATACTGTQVFRSPSGDFIATRTVEGPPRTCRDNKCPPCPKPVYPWYTRPWFIATMTILVTSAITIPATLIATGDLD